MTAAATKAHCSHLTDDSETIYLTSMPGMRQKLIDGLKAPLSECARDDDDFDFSLPSSFEIV